MNPMSNTSIVLQNFIFCTAIALLLWQFVPAIGQYGFWSCFVHSQFIGNSICLLAIGASSLLRLMGIEGKGIRRAILVLTTLAGTYLGMVFAAMVLGIPISVNEYLLDGRNSTITAIVAISASLLFNWHLGNRQNVLKLELAASEQSRRADQARLSMLQAQLEPHMLFNTLANLRALIDVDKDRALEMLDRLDSFLRETLRSSRMQTQSLIHEFGVLEDYLELSKVRFDHRLDYSLDLPISCQQLSVPSLLLQPLVENAIQHGIEPSLSGGAIRVMARRNGNQLVLSVSDTGVGIDTLPVEGESLATLSLPELQSGFGLVNLKERLAQAYGTAADIRFGSTRESAQRGLTVTLALPIGAGGESVVK